MRRSVAVGLFLAMSFGLCSCTAGNTAPDTPEPSASERETVETRQQLPHPEVALGMRKIKQWGPRRGSAQLGRIQLPKEFHLAYTCTADSGTGLVTLKLESVGEFTEECSSTEISPRREGMQLAEARSGKLEVIADEDVEWLLTVQVPEEK